jgi:hypothetical protein
VGMIGIIISPYSKKLRNGKNNPKNYPYWNKLVELLKKEGIYTIQIGLKNDNLIGADEFLFDLKLNEIRNLLYKYKNWISVDNFMGHFARFHGISGTVIFSRSNPKLFGYSENQNILKDEKYLRYNQYATWEESEYIEESFMKPEEILPIILNKVNSPK